ncbi:MAG: Gfo/Idh/MocA family oxidoreductase [Thermoguttaceae bacterium]|jgi:predicted dehydrogenase|nr:Gfo/Idh/MocA family oxidoreductase [Thermoguttaceae bacterium]
MSRIHRRTFLKGALGAASAAATITISGTKAGAKVIGANERLNIAIVGAGGRGRGHLGSYQKMENVEVTWVVDPDTRRAKDAPNTTSDIRKALDDKNLHAISVASPNHWHSLSVIWAAQAGKHCYVEKPASHDIYEGRVALAAARKYGVVVQHGTQQRSSQSRADMINAIHSGKYGKLSVSHGFCCKPRAGIGHKEPEAPPEWLDWNQWRGPAVIDQYHGNFVHYNWHWFWATGNGDLNNQGTHQLDVAFWGLDPGQTAPVRAMALGGRFVWNDQGETPNTMFAIAEYPNGQKVFFNVRNVNYDGYPREVKNDFYFEDGGKILGNTYISPSGEQQRVEGERAEITPGGNFGSFISACRAGKPEMANGDMEVAHYSCLLGHVMNNSYRIGKKVPFNKKAGRFGDDKLAYEEFMKVHEIMRDGVGIPEDGAEYTVGPWLDFDPAAERFTGEHADEANKLLRDPRREGFDIPTPDKV